MYQLIENISIQRRFVNLESRQVHYRISGAGPVLVLLHQSPTSSAEKAIKAVFGFKRDIFL